MEKTWWVCLTDDRSWQRGDLHSVIQTDQPAMIKTIPKHTWTVMEAMILVCVTYKNTMTLELEKSPKYDSEYKRRGGFPWHQEREVGSREAILPGVEGEAEKLTAA